MSRPLSYYAWPAGIVAFFLILAAGNTTLYILANDAHQGSELLEPRAYDSGLRYQERLNALDRLRSSGIQVEVLLSSETSPQTLEVRLTDAEEQPVEVKSLRGKAVYAAARAHDLSLELVPVPGAPGRYRAAFERRPGIYLLALDLENERGESMRLERLLR